MLSHLLWYVSLCFGVVSVSASCKTSDGQTVKCAQAGHPGGQCSITKSIDGSNPAACCASCIGTSGCDFWVFNGQTNQCYLKSGDMSYVVAAPGSSWGYPAAPPPPSPAPPSPIPPAPTPGCTASFNQKVQCAQAGHPGGQCSIIKTIDGGGAGECCRACSGYTGCDFWVFNEQYKECYLKSGDKSHVVSGAGSSWGYPTSAPPPAPPPPPAPCVGSRLEGQAIKCQGPDHPGGQCTILASFPSTSADQCCSWCAGTPKCEFWVLDKAGSQCYLKYGDSTYVIDNASHTSGLLNSHPTNSWPVFEDEASLKRSSWGTYFVSLYGSLPPAPLDVRIFWCFYLDKMQAAGVHPPPSVGQCPTSKDAPEGQRYDVNNAYSSKDLTWLWHPINGEPFTGFAANSIVEVSHQKDPFGDEHYGMWFLFAKGSGVFLDIGSTKIFADHQDAYKFFGATGNEDMCKRAAKTYDTIQFVKHVDGVNYPCAAKIGEPWMNIEIVAVKLTGTYACGQAQGTSAALRAGWDGSKPCKCDPSNPNTNCVFSTHSTGFNKSVVVI